MSADPPPWAMPPGWSDPIREAAHQLALAVKVAEEAGIPPAVLLPELLEIFQAEGMMPQGMEETLASVIGALR